MDQLNPTQPKHIKMAQSSENCPLRPTSAGDGDGGPSTADQDPNPNFDLDKKVVVIMGATGAGKSKLSIDLASHLSRVEIVNADSMQVYRGLDVLTNKVPISEQNGIMHHLLGTIDSSVEFTSKDFRDLAIPIIDDILSRNGLPVIVGGTNYYIQAMLSPFLFDDMHEDLSECSVSNIVVSNGEINGDYERLSEIDHVAANRLHPNDHRKIKRYLSLYASSGILPSELFQGEASQNWGQNSNFRYDCCFIWIDASISVLDDYVNRRVDQMLNSGILNEVSEIYRPNAVYTKGLLQSIGVREFDEFFNKYYNGGNGNENENILEVVLEGNDSEVKVLLKEAADRLKMNTRRLVRRQRRRLKRLKEYFGWDLHRIDATEAFICREEEVWQKGAVKPCVEIISNFLSEDISNNLTCIEKRNDVSRNLWVQFVCEACDNRVLRGTHEWEQHKRGKTHRKRVASMKKSNKMLCD
ncbi:hypothetical protein LUZ60_013371 [Juncus effusus]|nr:hypothetical protein LUZ60_013371 [Juncus effusus]